MWLQAMPGLRCGKMDAGHQQHRTWLCKSALSDRSELTSTESMSAAGIGLGFFVVGATQVTDSTKNGSHVGTVPLSKAS